MNNQELYDNFFNACIVYAEDNGNNPVDENNLCDLTDNGNGTITINAWYHDSPQPSDNDLKAYTVAQITDRIRIRNNQKALIATKMLSFTTTDRDELTPQEGVIIYNLTTQTVQVYTNQWKSLAFAS
jgi:hypothetical protein